MGCCKNQKFSVFLNAENTDAIGFCLCIIEFTLIAFNLFGINKHLRVNKLKLITSVNYWRISSPQKSIRCIILSENESGSKYSRIIFTHSPRSSVVRLLSSTFRSFLYFQF